jgi:hypothetical protein
MSVYASAHVSVIHLSVHLSTVCLSVHGSVNMSVCVSVCTAMSVYCLCQTVIWKINTLQGVCWHYFGCCWRKSEFLQRTLEKPFVRYLKWTNWLTVIMFLEFFISM